jgi:hypothetical protein
LKIELGLRFAEACERIHHPERRNFMKKFGKATVIQTLVGRSVSGRTGGPDEEGQRNMTVCVTEKRRLTPTEMPLICDPMAPIKDDHRARNAPQLPYSPKKPGRPMRRPQKADMVIIEPF